MRTAILGMAMLALGFAQRTLPHHSTANFDFTRSHTVTGTVQYFSFTNPHSFIDLMVEEPDGARKAYKIFTVARVVMMRTGWALDDLKAGDKVTITGNPDRKDPQYLYLRSVVFADGRVWNQDKVIER